jgi:hypothetical protein
MREVAREDPTVVEQYGHAVVGMARRVIDLAFDTDPS